MRFAIYLKRAVVTRFLIEAADKDDARDIVKMVAPSFLSEMADQRKAINTFEITGTEDHTSPLCELTYLERNES